MLPPKGTYARSVYDLLESRAGQEVTLNVKGRMGRKMIVAIRTLRKQFGCDIWNNCPGVFVLAGRWVAAGEGRKKYIDYVLTIPDRCV